jgi:hypothetical protein
MDARPISKSVSQPVSRPDNRQVSPAKEGNRVADNQPDSRAVNRLVANRAKVDKSLAADSRLAVRQTEATATKIGNEMIVPLLHRYKFRFTLETRP